MSSEIINNFSKEREIHISQLNESKNYSQQSEDISSFELYPKKNKNPHFDIFLQQISEIDFYPLDSRENFNGNYEKYLSITLKHISKMKNINFEFALEELSLSKELKLINSSSISELKRKTLFLDLDETLIHADFDEEFANDKTLKYDAIIQFEEKKSTYEKEIDLNEFEEEIENSSSRADDEICSVGIFVRNGVQEFLSKVSKYFDVGIFTASVKEYADAVINFLDPDKKFIKYRLYRNNCIIINNLFTVKDLRVIKELDLKSTVLVDNSIYSFAPQLSNGILINSFLTDKRDTELYNVLEYLLNFIISAEDVRKVNEQFFNFEKLINEINCSNI